MYISLFLDQIKLTVVNQTCPSVNEGSLKRPTIPVLFICLCRISAPIPIQYFIYLYFGNLFYPFVSPCLVSIRVEVGRLGFIRCLLTTHQVNIYITGLKSVYKLKHKLERIHTSNLVFYTMFNASVLLNGKRYNYTN